MRYSLNLFSAIRDSDFKKIVFYDKQKIVIILTLSFISVFIYATFPLVTQVFINLYGQKNINLLALATIIFFVVFLLKLLIDIVVEKYEIKYFIKIDKNIKELIINKYGADPKSLFGKRSMLYKKNVFLYTLLIKTIYGNLQDIAKILIISIVIFFYDKKLFLYLSLMIPILLLFYYASIRISKAAQPDNPAYFESDFALMLKKSIDLNYDDKTRKKYYMGCLEETMKKRIRDRSRLVGSNVLMRSLINFFRLFYLTYFGYYIILYNFKLDGLIVGLLYITILIRPLINILIYASNYEKCSRSFFKINSLLK